MNEKEPSALVVFQQARASKQRAALREASQASKLKRPIGKLQNDYDVKGQPNARRHYIGALKLRGQVGSRTHWSKERLVINLESLLLHGNEDLREQILNREERGKKKSNAQYGTKRKSYQG